MARKSPPPPANREVRLLFGRCAAGDPEAWSGFMAAYHPLLRHLVGLATLAAVLAAGAYFILVIYPNYLR